MYEEMTYDVILQRMLDRIPDTLDKREGSIIYDALAPAAVELQDAYLSLDAVIQESYADTATREYLIRRAAERGITPEEATYAILQGEFTPTTLTEEDLVGKRFNIDNLNFIVTEAIDESAGTYQVQCESTGAEGSQHLGSMIPIDYIDGLETATLTAVLIPGEDEESTDSIRERYFDSFESKAFGGNQQDYIEQTNAIAGVGDVKVTPVWNGGGTVLLTILNSDYDVASSTLVDLVQETIDPDPQGEGVGIAPIGHTVTVQSAEAVTVDITVSITFQEGYSWSGQQAAIEEAMEAYMLEIRTAWADESASVVRISQIETRILNVEGVLDVSDTTINGSASNLALGAYEVPELGGVTNG